jgi:hypothetical protein
MLDDAGLEALRVQYGGRIAVVEWYGHQLVFRKPSRDDIREYRRKGGTTEEPDRVDQLTQVMLCAFDGQTDPVGARTAYLGFLSEYPLFTSTAKCNAAVNVLSGLVEVESAEALGKFVRLLSARPKPTAPASPNGSVTSPAASPSPTPEPSPQN